MTIGITHSTAADDTFSDAGVIAWDAGHTVSGGTAGSILFVNASGGMTEDNANLKWGTTAGQGLTANAGTATTDVNALNLTQTWDNAAVVFTGAKIVITDTASAAGSLALQILGGAAGATNLLSLTKAGLLTLLGSINALGGKLGNAFDAGYYSSVTVGMASNVVLAFSNSAASNGTKDVGFSRASAGLMLLGTGTAGSFAGRMKLTSAIAAGVAVGSLNAAPTAGEVQSVTDALAPAVGAAVAAGGAAQALVWWNGAQWTVIGI